MFRKKEDKTCDESFYCSRNRVTHHMFYIPFCETFETTQMIRKMFYIDFCEIFKRNHFDRTMFYMYFFMHIKISPTGKSVLSFIPSGTCIKWMFSWSYTNSVLNISKIILRGNKWVLPKSFAVLYYTGNSQLLNDHACGRELTGNDHLLTQYKIF